MNKTKLAEKTIYEMHADVCKTLGHPLRIEIIDLLQYGEMCFSDILEKTGGLKSNLSQHLSVMTASGITKTRKESRCSYYSLTSKKVAKACQLMREVLIDSLKGKQSILDHMQELVK